MPSRSYRVGYHFEHNVVAPFFRGLGYFAIESRGSHGLADIVAIPARDSFHYPQTPLLIQCKKGKHRPTSKLYDHLKENSKWNAEFLVAYGTGKNNLVIENLDKKDMRFV